MGYPEFIDEKQPPPGFAKIAMKNRSAIFRKKNHGDGITGTKAEQSRAEEDQNGNDQNEVEDSLTKTR